MVSIKVEGLHMEGLSELQTRGVIDDNSKIICLSQRKGTVELQWLEHLWDHEIMCETGGVRANECTHSARSGGIIGIYSHFL